jgi:hypothetical protein
MLMTTMLSQQLSFLGEAVYASGIMHEQAEQDAG